MSGDIRQPEVGPVVGLYARPAHDADMVHEVTLQVEAGEVDAVPEALHVLEERSRYALGSLA